MQYVDPIQTPQPPVNPENSESPQATPHQERSKWRSISSTTGTVLFALLLAFALVNFVFRTYEVSGISMANTLQDGNRLLIWKVPRTWARITGHQYVPDRGDIVIFNQPDLLACNQSGTKQLVKRVIGLPGDRVVVKNNAYIIYDKQHPSGFNPDTTLSYFKGVKVPSTPGDTDLTLGPDQLFVSGDNRLQSCDSRAFGPIHTDQVIGQLSIRLLPFKERHIF